jgi:hypothetical protein
MMSDPHKDGSDEICSLEENIKSLHVSDGNGSIEDNTKDDTRGQRNGSPGKVVHTDTQVAEDAVVQPLAAEKNHQGSGCYTMICDCGYGWPTQKRPRLERIRAVSRQICNFIEWRQGKEEKEKEHVLETSRLLVTGDGDDDVNPIQEQLTKLGVEKDCIEYERQSMGVLAPENNRDKLVYLSPEAPELLDISKAPPRTVVIGMLVDRKVTAGRSQTRANKLGVQSYRLPLGLIKLEGLEDSEPLNIDTVMEMMQRWWVNHEELQQSTTDPTPCEYKRCFLDAAVQAMFSHQERHPQRTLHK